MIKKEIKELLYELSPSGYIVSLDLETTGIDKSKDKIIEIGAVKYDIKNGSKEYFSQLINPVVQISEFIEDLTGISNSDVENMPIIDEVKNEFEEFYCDYENNQHLIIAHNANFDIGFLKSNGFNFNNNIFDTYDLAYTLIDKGDYNLESLASFFNIDVILGIVFLIESIKLYNTDDILQGKKTFKFSILYLFLLFLFLLFDQYFWLII